MIYSTTSSLYGFEILKYVGVAQTIVIGYPELNSNNPISELFSKAVDQFDEKFNAIIDIHIQSAGTFTSDDNGSKWPDLLIYGTAVRVKKEQI